LGNQNPPAQGNFSKFKSWILIRPQTGVAWLEGKKIPAKPVRTSCSGDPQKSTFSLSKTGRQFVMSGSSDSRLKFRGALFPSLGLAEYWRGADAGAADIAELRWKRQKLVHLAKWV
jgi:hypothetical protein